MIDILQALWPKNKAKGLLAQAVLTGEINRGDFGADGREKFLDGCWLVAPRRPDSYKFRFAFFVHPAVMDLSAPDLSPREILGDKYRPFHALAEFLQSAGIGVMYIVTTARGARLPVDEIKRGSYANVSWKLYSFEGGKFRSRDTRAFFDRWEGRGRPSRGNEWDEETKVQIAALPEPVLTNLLLNELFFSGLFKSVLAKGAVDPYDVDSFLVSISQRHILPMEIKEKSAGTNGKELFFGIDAGRIMMLLRLCLPNDSNSVYLIREVDQNRAFVGWKYVTLSDIIMSCSWNLQAGGPGMGGQATQTVKIPYPCFKNFGPPEISETSLARIGEMPKEIRAAARDFGAELASHYFSNSSQTQTTL